MTLPADAQEHLLAAFHAHIAADDGVIPPAIRYRMYAERIVHHPLPEWQALTVEEARVVYKQLATLSTLPPLTTERNVCAPTAAEESASEPPPWVTTPDAELRTPNSEQPSVDADQPSLETVHRTPGIGLPFSAPPPVRRSTFEHDPYPQPDPGAQLRVPGLYCPGRAVATLPDSPEPGRLYGLPAGQDWVTVSAQAQKGSLTYRWASRRAGEAGEGSRAQFDTWLSNRVTGKAA